MDNALLKKKIERNVEFSLRRDLSDNINRQLSDTHVMLRESRLKCTKDIRNRRFILLLRAQKIVDVTRYLPRGEMYTHYIFPHGVVKQLFPEISVIFHLHLFVSE